MNNVNVTVLKDESLSAAGRVVEREYNEVKRAACVGERIKIVDAFVFSDYSNGDTFEVTDLTGVGNALIIDNAGERECVYPHEYVVLEPTDTIRINSERFRMVDRKAAVGERVIIVSTHMYHGIPLGVVGRIYRNDTFEHDYATFFVGNGTDIDIERDYRVLEPLNTPLSSRPAAEQSAEIIATLTAEVESLKKRVSALENPVAQPGEAVRKIIAKLDAVKSPQEIRDEIVARAKVDVKALSLKVAGHDWYNSEIPSFEKHGPLVFDFGVNRDKRKVTAVARYKHVPDVVAVVGRAVCAPNDVFNAHIGRAIALRRALGLEVPAEYLSVPAPEIANIGDIVKTYGALKFEVTYGSSAASVTRLLRSGDAEILDDTREEVAA